MKKQFITLATVLFVLGCNTRHKPAQQSSAVVTSNSISTLAQEVQQTQVPAENEMVMLNNYLDELRDPVQHFSTKGNGAEVLKGKKGISIRIVPADLEYADGSAVTGKVDVQFIECMKQGDFVRNNVPTTSNGRLLVSGGSCYINCTAEGKQLKLKLGKTLAIGFPKQDQPGMQLFYGVKNTDGTVNWKPANVATTVAPIEDSVWVKVRRVVERDTVLATLEKGKTTNMNDFANYGGLTFDEKEGHVVLASHIKMLSDTGYEMRKISAALNAENNMMSVINTNQLGWINCDRFYNMPEKTSLALSMPTQRNDRWMRAFIIYKDINSVASYYVDFSNKNEYSIPELPANMAARIIVISYKDGLTSGDYQDIVIGQNKKIEIAMNPLTKLDIVKMMNVQKG